MLSSGPAPSSPRALGTSSPGVRRPGSYLRIFRPLTSPGHLSGHSPIRASAAPPCPARALVRRGEVAEPVPQEAGDASSSSRVRPAASRNRRQSRSPARPPSSAAMDRSHPFNPTLERRYRSVRPSICSANVFREQFLRSQKYLRTRSRTTTRWDPTGRSESRRWYELCTRLARRRQSGHRPGRVVDTASTTSPPGSGLTRSIRTPSPENSTFSTTLTVTEDNTPKKRSCVLAADLGIHGTPVRAEGPSLPSPGCPS